MCLAVPFKAPLIFAPLIALPAPFRRPPMMAPEAISEAIPPPNSFILPPLAP